MENKRNLTSNSKEKISYREHIETLFSTHPISLEIFQQKNYFAKEKISLHNNYSQ